MRFTCKLLTISLLLHSILSISSLKDYTNILGDPNKSNDNTITCIEKISKQYFPCGTHVTIVTQNKDVDQLIQSISKENCYSFIIKFRHGHNWLVWNDVYVIISEDVAEFLSIVSYLSKDILWNPNGAFVVTLQNVDPSEVSKVMKICVWYKIYNVLLLIPSDNNNSIMFTYYPFGKEKCGDNIDPVNLGGCDDINNRINIFANKKPTSLQNCSFRVIASDDGPNFIFDSSNFINGESVLGLEQYILQTIQEKERCEFSYTLVPDHHYGVVLPNGTATGLLKSLEENEADIVAGGFILIQNRLDRFDFISGINYASFSVFIPNIDDPGWKDVYKEFGPITWILIIFTFGLMAAICRKILNSIPNSPRNRNILLSLWGYLVGNASTKLAKEKKLRVMMIFWLWFSFFITSFYYTALYSLVTRRVQIKRHMNPENLAELSYQPCITDSTREFFLFAYNQDLPEGKYYPECRYTESALKFIASRKDLYAIEMDYAYALHKFNYVTEEGVPKLDSSQFSNNIYIGFYVNKGFAFKKMIENYVHVIQESGLLNRQHNLILRQSRSATRRRKQHLKRKRMADFLLHYILLLLGCSISSICFISEIVIGKRGKDRNNKK